MNDNIPARFVDTYYNELFHISEGERLRITWFDGQSKLVACKGLDEYHIVVDHRTWHIHEFAAYCQRAGAVFQPEHPHPGDMDGSYEIYQIQNTASCEYSYMDYDYAKNCVQASDYHRVYTGNLADCVSLENLWILHNKDARPFGQRMNSMSMSDIVVTHRLGQSKAFYVDSVGFQQLPSQILSELAARPNRIHHKRIIPKER